MTGISKLTTVEIASRTYSSINNATDWDFIKRNYSEIKIIKKNLVIGLFAADEMKSIKNDFDLNHFQYSNDNLFLMDFTSRIAELNKQKELNQELINEHETIVKKVKGEIKQKIETHIQEEIVKLDVKLKSYDNRQEKLSIELAKREAELTSIEQTAAQLKTALSRNWQFSG